jgi:MoaA/NifB/PqqE/SkfB family radical SAM enzyme
MKIPEIVLLRVKNKTIACDLRHFQFIEADVPMNIPIDYRYKTAEIHPRMNPIVMDILKQKIEAITVNPSSTQVYLNSTTICRGSCKYCYADNHPGLPLQFSDVTSAIHNQGIPIDQIQTFTMLGGEPIMNLTLINDLLTNTSAKVSIATGLFISYQLFSGFMSLLEKYTDRLFVSVSMDPDGSLRSGYSQENVYDWSLEVLKHKSRIKSTICSGAINYPRLRSRFEQDLGREIEMDFDLVNKSEYHPTDDEIQTLQSYLLIDAHEHLLGNRQYVPLYTVDLARALAQTDDPNFIVTTGCGVLTDAFVINPGGIITRCCEPLDKKITMDDIDHKCSICPILRYCGVRCYLNSGKRYMCNVSKLKLFTALYIMAWKDKRWS